MPALACELAEIAVTLRAALTESGDNKARVEDLEGELEDAKEEHEKLEKRVTELDEKLFNAEQDLRELRGGKPA